MLVLKRKKYKSQDPNVQMSQEIIEEAIDSRKHIIFNYKNARGDRGLYLALPLRIKQPKKKREPFDPAGVYVEVIYKKSKITRAPGYVKPKGPQYRDPQRPLVIKFTLKNISDARIPQWWEYLFFDWVFDAPD